MAAKQPAPKQPPTVNQPKEKKVGTIEHYYPKVHAASVGLQGDLKLGDQIHIKGHGDDLRENVVSMQIDHKPIQEGHAGQHIGLEVPMKVHKKAEVFKVQRAKAAPKKPAKGAKAKPASRKAAKKAPKRAKKAAKKASRTKRPAAKRAKGKRKAAKKTSRKAAKRPAKGAPKRAARK